MSSSDDDGPEDHSIFSLVLGMIGLGIPGVLVIVFFLAAGGVLGGFLISSVFSFLSHWMPPLVFLVAGLFVFYELSSRGTKNLLIGVLVLVVLITLGFVVYFGISNGPSASYNSLLSLAPGGQSVSYSVDSLSSAIFAASVALGMFGLAYGGYRVYGYFEEN